MTTSVKYPISGNKIDEGLADLYKGLEGGDMAAPRLATWLDVKMLQRNGCQIAPPGTPNSQLPVNPGPQVAQELGNRYLLRYLLDSQLTAFLNGTSAPQYVTPTPYGPRDAVRWLALPAPNLPRRYALLLDPSLIPDIGGPRWVQFGGGIEYFLPNGFPASAIVDVGPAPGTRWPLRVD